ncbi:hypothetical protein CF327_g6824 [Tilletia walkeri]|nr:hypothetical protein CF327_g6824 [Tilletia walkeri]
MPTINLARRRRAQTTPARAIGEDPPPFFAVDWLQRQRRHNTTALATQDQSAIERRISATVLLNQNGPSGFKAFRLRRPSTPLLEDCDNPGSSSAQRSNHQNSWLDPPAVRAESSLKHFVSERKASVDSIVRKVRAFSGTFSAGQYLPMSDDQSGPGDGVHYIYNSPHQDLCPPHESDFARVAISSAQTRQLSKEPLLSTSILSNPVAEDGSHHDAQSFAFHTPRAIPSTNTPWIDDLSSAPSPFPETADSEDPLPSRPKRSARRHTLTKPPNPLPPRHPNHSRRPSAPSDYLSPESPAEHGSNEMAMHSSPAHRDGRTRQLSHTPIIVASTSDAEIVPVNMPDEPDRREASAHDQMDTSPKSDSFQQLVKPSAIGGHPIFDITDCRTLQLRIIQLEKELHVARNNTDMWMTKYAILSANLEPQPQPQPQQQQQQQQQQQLQAQTQTQTSDKRRWSFKGPNAIGDAELEGAAIPIASTSPRERKSRRLSVEQASIHSVHGLLFAPVEDRGSPILSDDEMAAEQHEPSAQVLQEVVHDTVDSKEGETEMAAESTSIRSKRKHEREESGDGGNLPSHRPLSISENLNYLASAPSEGIDAATLNSLMPEETGNRRQRGFSGTATSGITNMAAGLKAKLRSSPASNTQPLPSMPPKSPHRSTYKLFGRRTSTLQSSNASIHESVASPALGQSSNGAADGGSLYRFASTSISSPRDSRAFDTASITNNRFSVAEPTSSPVKNRQRSASVTSKLSLSSLQTATKRVSATLNSKSSALRMHGIGNGSTDSSGARLITPSMIGQPVLVSSRPSMGDLEEAAEIRDRGPSMDSRPPDWLETIAFEAASSDEDEGSPAPRSSARRQHTRDDMASAKASSTVLARYTDLPSQLSRSHSNDSIRTSKAEYKVDEPNESVTLGSDDRLPSEHVSGAKTNELPVNQVSSSSTPPGVNGNQAVVQAQGNTVEDVKMATSPAKPSTPSMLGVELDPNSSTNSRSEATGGIPPMKRSDMVPFSGPAWLQSDPPKQKVLMSTRISTRSQSSLRNRPPLANSVLNLASGPMSQSPNKTGSHEVRISVPQSPAPPSPAPSSSPLAVVGVDPKSPNKSQTALPAAPTPKKKSEAQSVATTVPETTTVDVKKESKVATPASTSTPTKTRTNPLTKLYKHSLIPRKSTSNTKIATTTLPSLPSAGSTPEHSLVPLPTTVVARVDPVGSNIPVVANPTKSVLSRVRLPTPPQEERPAQEAQNPQAMSDQLDWLHAMEALGGDGPDTDSAATKTVQADPEAKFSLPVRVGSLQHSEVIGLGLDISPPPLPSKKATPKYAHITPPTSDAE